LTKNYFSITMGRLGATVAGTDPCSTGGHPQLQQKEKRRHQMNKFRFTIQMLAVATFLFAAASMAQAQATRTWVSGVGDDVNPCSRTAPCKTWAGAISKTADGGEIDALDPGGFGTVTITKSITLDGNGTLASILNAGTNGINLNDSASGAPMTKVARIRNLTINGAGTGFDGIRYTSGKALYVENCVIYGNKGNGVNSDGIEVNLTADGGQLFVRDSIIGENSGDGIRVTTSVGQVKVNLDNVRADRNGGNAGIHFVNNSSAYMNNCRTSMNTIHGVQVENNTSLSMDHSSSFGNGNSGLSGGGGTPSVRISDVSLFNNVNAGINFNGATVFSFQDNKIRGNGGGDLVGGSLNTSQPKQ
jgi:parallel beta helix pectate lyase-like protein